MSDPPKQTDLEAAIGSKKQHCYFIVSPNPQHGLHLSTTGDKIQAYLDRNLENSEEITVKNNEPILFIKFGDEDDFTDRVKDYRTENPSCMESSCAEAFILLMSDSLVAEYLRQKTGS